MGKQNQVQVQLQLQRATYNKNPGIDLYGKPPPPAPYAVLLKRKNNTVAVEWNIEGYSGIDFEIIQGYEVYYTKEDPPPPYPAMWLPLGQVAALPLPIACVMPPCVEGATYYYAVRAVDSRCYRGSFSNPVKFECSNQEPLARSCMVRNSGSYVHIYQG